MLQKIKAKTALRISKHRLNGNVTQIYRHTCEQEAHPSVTVEQLRPDSGPLTHRASKVRNPRRYEDFLVPPGDSIPRSSQRSGSGGFCSARRVNMASGGVQWA